MSGGGGGPFYNDAFLDRVVNDLGLTMIRNEYYPDGENWGNKQLDYVKALKAKADASGEPMRFITSYWTPPARFKTNNSQSNGGSVYPHMYGELANYCVETIRRYKQDAGIDLYALSFTNEPSFVHSFNSCVWTPEEYSNFLTILGEKFKTENIATKIFGPEHMLSDLGFFNKPLVMENTKEYLGAFAIHGYIDGINPIEGTSRWVQLGGMQQQWNKPAWQTEISGYTNDWSSAFTYAQGLGVGLRHGNVAVWLWWQLSEGKDDQYLLMPNQGGTGKKYYVSKNYYRYIRPGAVRIKSAQSDATVLEIAFYDESKQQLIMILINTDAAARTVTLSGTGLPASYTAYRTSSGENCQNVGSMSRDNISLPAGSITTLVGDGYNPSWVSVRPETVPAPTTAAMPLFSGDARMFSIQGRSMNRPESRSIDGVAAGVVIMRDGSLVRRVYRSH